MSDFKIIQDTREQRGLFIKEKPMTFEKYKKAFESNNRDEWLDYINSFVKGDYAFGTLNPGDYSIAGYEDKIAIERKSAMDLFGTMGKGNKRFHAELARAKDYDYFAIVVETNYANLYNKEFENAFRSKMKGFIVISTLFTFHMKYGIPIFLCNGRAETKKIVKELFKSYLRNKEVFESE